jgi:hypothetical protein
MASGVRLVYPPCMVVEPQQEEVDAHQVPTTPITCPWTMKLDGIRTHA